MKLWLQHQHIVIIIIQDNQDLIKHNNNYGQPYWSPFAFVASYFSVWLTMAKSRIDKLDDIIHYSDWAIQAEGFLEEKEVWDIVSGDEMFH
jgi:hypothetical protein